MVYQQKMWQSYLVFFLLILLTAYAFVYRLNMPTKTQIPTDEQISNFDECANAGNAIMESFPRQCANGGKTFIEGVLYNDLGIEIIPDGKISGQVQIGPFCPLKQENVLCNVPTAAYTSRIARLYDSRGENVIEWRNIKEDGTFEFSPPAGVYFVDVSPGGMGPVDKYQVQVYSNQISPVVISIDTGIR